MTNASRQRGRFRPTTLSLVEDLNPIVLWGASGLLVLSDALSELRNAIEAEPPDAAASPGRDEPSAVDGAGSASFSRHESGRESDRTQHQPRPTSASPARGTRKRKGKV